MRGGHTVLNEARSILQKENKTKAVSQCRVTVNCIQYKLYANLYSVLMCVLYKGYKTMTSECYCQLKLTNRQQNVFTKTQ